MCLLRFNNVLIRVNNKLISILLTVNKCLLMAPYYKVLPKRVFSLNSKQTNMKFKTVKSSFAKTDKSHFGKK